METGERVNAMTMQTNGLWVAFGWNGSAEMSVLIYGGIVSDHFGLAVT
jgi:hypothetical protein